MNKQQLYTFGGALLASTALTGSSAALTLNDAPAGKGSVVPFPRRLVVVRSTRGAHHLRNPWPDTQALEPMLGYIPVLIRGHADGGCLI